jgi:2-polyprenyl-3-methyl-5-hydroxy-6-metoxy-1,4-benzoquinol methylase
VVAPADVLDAGCGTGTYAAELASRGFHVTGIDLSSELIKHARRFQHSGAIFEVVDLLTFSPVQPHDAILCRGVLNDLVEDGDRHRAIRSLAQALRSGGVFICDVREWHETARRKAQKPVFEKRIETSRGTLTYRSTVHLDHINHRLLVDETHELRTATQAVRSATYEFVMRCWTHDELDRHLAEAGLGRRDYFGGYSPTDWPTASDRIIAVASHQ